jgi:hypothetical protein
MTAIDTAMLAAMRAAIAELLPDTAAIITITNTPDGEGGQTVTRGTASTVAFRLDMTSGREQVSGGAVQPFTAYKGSLPYDAAITTANQILHNGTYYAVTSVNTGQSWQAVCRVDLEKL